MRRRNPYVSKSKKTVVPYILERKYLKVRTDRATAEEIGNWLKSGWITEGIGEYRVTEVGAEKIGGDFYAQKTELIFNPEYRDAIGDLEYKKGNNSKVSVPLADLLVALSNITTKGVARLEKELLGTDSNEDATKPIYTAYLRFLQELQNPKKQRELIDTTSATLKRSITKKWQNIVASIIRNVVARVKKSELLGESDKETYTRRMSQIYKADQVLKMWFQQNLPTDEELRNYRAMNTAIASRYNIPTSRHHYLLNMLAGLSVPIIARDSKGTLTEKVYFKTYAGKAADDLQQEISGATLTPNTLYDYWKAQKVQKSYEDWLRDNWIPLIKKWDFKPQFMKKGGSDIFEIYETTGQIAEALTVEADDIADRISPYDAFNEIVTVIEKAADRIAIESYKATLNVINNESRKDVGDRCFRFDDFIAALAQSKAENMAFEDYDKSQLQNLYFDALNPDIVVPVEGEIDVVVQKPFSAEDFEEKDPLIQWNIEKLRTRLQITKNRRKYAKELASELLRLEKLTILQDYIADKDDASCIQAKQLILQEISSIKAIVNREVEFIEDVLPSRMDRKDILRAYQVFLLPGRTIKQRIMTLYDIQSLFQEEENDIVEEIKRLQSKPKKVSSSVWLSRVPAALAREMISEKQIQAILDRKAAFIKNHGEDKWNKLIEAYGQVKDSNRMTEKYLELRQEWLGLNKEWNAIEAERLAGESTREELEEYKKTVVAQEESEDREADLRYISEEQKLLEEQEEIEQRQEEIQKQLRSIRASKKRKSLISLAEKLQIKRDEVAYWEKVFDTFGTQVFRDYVAPEAEKDLYIGDFIAATINGEPMGVRIADIFEIDDQVYLEVLTQEKRRLPREGSSVWVITDNIEIIEKPKKLIKLTTNNVLGYGASKKVLPSQKGDPRLIYPSKGYKQNPHRSIDFMLIYTSVMGSLLNVFFAQVWNSRRMRTVEKAVDTDMQLRQHVANLWSIKQTRVELSYVLWYFFRKASKVIGQKFQNQMFALKKQEEKPYPIDYVTGLKIFLKPQQVLSAHFDLWAQRFSVLNLHDLQIYLFGSSSIDSTRNQSFYQNVFRDEQEIVNLESVGNLTYVAWNNTQSTTTLPKVRNQNVPYIGYTLRYLNERNIRSFSLVPIEEGAYALTLPSQFYAGTSYSRRITPYGKFHRPVSEEQYTGLLKSPGLTLQAKKALSRQLRESDYYYALPYFYVSAPLLEATNKLKYTQEVARPAPRSRRRNPGGLLPDRFTQIDEKGRSTQLTYGEKMRSSKADFTVNCIFPLAFIAQDALTKWYTQYYKDYVQALDE